MRIADTLRMSAIFGRQSTGPSFDEVNLTALNTDAPEPAPAADFTDLVNRTEGLQPWRRIFHGAGGLLLAALLHRLGPGSTAATGLLVLAVLTGALLDVVRLNSRSANRWFFRWFSVLASPREAARVASSTWYVVGVLGVHLAFPDPVLVPSLLVLALADPAASVVGRLWGRRKVGKGSVEGVFTFWIVAMAVLVPFVGLPKGAGIAAVVALSEILPTKLDDNLVIPLVTAVALWTTS